MTSFCVFRDTHPALAIAVMTSHKPHKSKRRTEKQSVSTEFKTETTERRYLSYGFGRVELLMVMKISG